MMRRVLFTAVLVVAAMPLTAQVTVVTPSDNHGWAPIAFCHASSGSGWSNTCLGTTSEITTNYPRSGLGSGEISIADNANTESDFYMDFASPMALSSLSAISYDWFRSSSSTTGGLAAPSFALWLTGWSGVLVYEPYNNMAVPGNVPLNQWTHESNMLGGTWWFNDASGTQTGSCATYGAYQTLAAFNSQCYNNHAMVLELNIYMGFSGPDSFHAAFDNVQYAFNDVGTTFNFEPDAQSGVVPEPASMTLLATGLVGMAGAAMRRRKRSTKA